MCVCVSGIGVGISYVLVSGWFSENRKKERFLNQCVFILIPQKLSHMTTYLREEIPISPHFSVLFTLLSSPSKMCVIVYILMLIHSCLKKLCVYSPINITILSYHNIYYLLLNAYNCLYIHSCTLLLKETLVQP